MSWEDPASQQLNAITISEYSSQFESRRMITGSWISEWVYTDGRQRIDDEERREIWMVQDALSATRCPTLRVAS